MYDMLLGTGQYLIIKRGGQLDLWIIAKKYITAHPTSCERKPSDKSQEPKLEKWLQCNTMTPLTYLKENDDPLLQV